MTEPRVPIPPGVVSTIRGYWQRPALAVVTWCSLALSALTIVLPDRLADPVGVAVVTVIVATPLLRVGWLVFRWVQERDRRFIVTGAALLAVVLAGALLAMAGVGR